MDQAFRDEMAAGYSIAEPSIELGSPMLDGELFNGVRVQVALSMANRHGLIAGATGTGKTKTLQLLAGELSKAGVPVFVADIKGDVTGHRACPVTPRTPEIQRARRLHWLDVRAERPPGRVPVAVGRARCPGPGHRPQLRAAPARQGPRPQRDPDLDPVAGLQVLRRQRPAAARPAGSRDDAEVPRVGRGQADPRRLRRDVRGLRRRAPALARGPRAGGRRHVLRRARVRRRRPAADDARRARDHRRSSSCAT